MQFITTTLHSAWLGKNFSRLNNCGTHCTVQDCAISKDFNIQHCFFFFLIKSWCDGKLPICWKKIKHTFTSETAYRCMDGCFSSVMRSKCFKGNVSTMQCCCEGWLKPVASISPLDAASRFKFKYKTQWFIIQHATNWAYFPPSHFTDVWTVDGIVQCHFRTDYVPMDWQ